MRSIISSSDVVHKNMSPTIQEADFPFLADWCAISLRWLSLLAIAVRVATADAFTTPTTIVLGLAIFWNVGVSILALTNRRLKGHRVINVIMDFLIGALLFILSGGLVGPLIWSGVISLVSAAIYFEWRGGIIAALLLSLAQDAWIYFLAGDTLNLQSAGLLIASNLLAGTVLGLLGGWLMHSLRSSYQTQLRLRKEAEQRVQMKERERLQTLYNMIETLSTTLNYKIVLDNALDLSSNALGIAEGTESNILSAMLLFNENTLTVGAARRFSPRDLKLTFPAEQGILQETLKSGEIKTLKDPFKDPELCRIVAMQACKVVVCLPLLRGLNAFGVMLFGHPDPDFFNRDRCDVLEMVSHQATIAIQNARLYQDLEFEKEHILDTQEETRKKLARDLHDGPTQSVAVIAMRLNIARKMMETNVQDAAEEIAKVEELARHTTQEIRHMLFTLRPLVLETEGLTAALQAMADKMHDTFQQAVKIEIDPAVEKELEISKQTVVFYLVEEAANNARKHAKADLISASLHYLPNDNSLALLQIADNGEGFDVKAVTSSYEKRGSLGMVNLSERTELINGMLHIESAPGKGTKVQVLIPLTNEAVDRLERGLGRNQK
jgi:signal transduction histidine kinase